MRSLFVPVKGTNLLRCKTMFLSKELAPSFLLNSISKFCFDYAIYIASKSRGDEKNILFCLDNWRRPPYAEYYVPLSVFIVPVRGTLCCKIIQLSLRSRRETKTTSCACTRTQPLFF